MQHRLVAFCFGAKAFGWAIEVYTVTVVLLWVKHVSGARPPSWRVIHRRLIEAWQRSEHYAQQCLQALPRRYGIQKHRAKIEPSESSFQKCVMCRATKAQNGKRQSFYSLSLELHTTCVSREHGKRNINRRLHGMTRVWYKQAPLLGCSYTVPNDKVLVYFTTRLNELTQ